MGRVWVGLIKNLICKKYSRIEFDTQKPVGEIWHLNPNPLNFGSGSGDRRVLKIGFFQGFSDFF
jgi:hypothetical protein